MAQPRSVKRSRRGRSAPLGLERPLAVVLLTIALLVPFVNKAFHVDDALFLAVADQIREAPTRPYEFTYNWFGTPVSMWEATQNPPLNAYLLAAIGAVAGENETVYHLVYLAMAAGCAAILFDLARRWCGQPFLATVLTVVSPAFLVSATNVMADVPLLLLMLLAVRFTVRAAEGAGDANLWWAGLAAAAALMTKYFGAALVPLLAVYWLLRTRRISVHLAAFGIPLLVAFAWGLYSKSAADLVHPLAAAEYAAEASNRLSARTLQFGNSLAFLGGALLWPVALLPFLIRSRRWIAGSVVLATAGIFAACVGELPAGVRLEWALMVGGGATVLALGATAWQRRSDADDVLLGMWLAGTIVFVMFFNWTVSSRAILPAAFPAAVLVLRRLGFEGPAAGWLRYLKVAALPVAAVSVLLALADGEVAAASRDFARTTARAIVRDLDAGPLGARVTFFGHWGFQYYLEREGIRAHDVRERTRPGDLVLVAYNNSNVSEIRRIPKVRRFDRVIPSSFGVHTMNAISHAAFYSTVAGPVPFALAGDVPSDRLAVYEVVQDPKPAAEGQARP